MLQPHSRLFPIAPYQPGRPAESDDGSLASNESFIAASPAAHAAGRRALLRSHRYPDPLSTELRVHLAQLHQADPDEILVSNGSDEIIYLIATAYLGQGSRIVCAEPPYWIADLSARIVGSDVVRVPLRDWKHDLDAMAKVQADIAYVVNPNNPTGAACDRSAITNFVSKARSSLTIVDEAYIDFADSPRDTSSLPLTEPARVAVVRTCSKAYGLAGLRIGYLVGARDLVATLRQVRAPFSVNAVAQAAALAALRDTEHYELVRATVRHNRARLIQLLTDMGFSVAPSQTNFVLVQSTEEEWLVRHLAANRIAVRPGTTLGMPGTVRITVPSERGLELLERALAHLPPVSERAHAG